jgi:hypothetical protein
VRQCLLPEILCFGELNIALPVTVLAEPDVANMYSGLDSCSNDRRVPAIQYVQKKQR